MEVFVARQPIFDRRQRVFGYELLFRSSQENVFSGIDADQATSRVITDSLLTFGSRTMTRGRKAFINFSREFILGDYAALLPNDWVVVEVLETVLPEPEVVAACQRLKDRGYLIAMDDFEFKPGYEPLLRLADVVKIDFLALRGGQRAEQVQKLGDYQLALLAEKVETLEDYAAAKGMGFSYFQGYFFARPVIVSGQEVPGFKLAYLDLLRQINRPDMDYGGLEQVIKRDVSLSYKLLRYINSAFFALRNPVSSIQQALALLGENNVRKWASLVALAHLAQDRPDELVASSLVRARLCENLAGEAGLKGRESDLFLMGLFSQLEPLVGRPLTELISDMPLHKEVKEALTGRPNRLGQLFGLIRAYEQGDWHASASLCSRLGMDEQAVPHHYLDALSWSQVLTEQ